MKTRFLLINAIDITQAVQTSLPPLGLGYLISSLRIKFGNDLIEYKIVDRDVSKEISIYKPNIIGITCVSQNYNYAIDYAKLAKKHKIPVLIGGTHITVLPSTLTKDMEVATIGEGEETIKELFSIFLEKKRFPKKDLHNLKGIAFWEAGKIVLTEIRPPISDMDSIPNPARDLMKIEKCTHVFSSRGCPYRCTFCASSRFWNSTRFFSAKYVVAEVKYLYNTHGVKQVDFWDDLFIVSKPRIKEIISLMRKEKILGKLSFSCAVRSNLIDDSMVKLLHKLNVKSVSMGLESGTPRVLNYLKGDTINIKDHVRAIKLFKKYGIEPSASFIIGSPDETREEILQTFDFIKESKLRGFGIYVLTPFPGTPIWEYARKKGLITEKMDWSTLNVEFMERHEKAITVSNTLTKEELYQLLLKFKNEQKKRKYLDYIKHPKNILRQIYHLIKNVAQPTVVQLLLKFK
jgi:anaerobic magnesium-protoporphyrin IX monomethyl ester cyclase